LKCYRGTSQEERIYGSVILAQSPEHIGEAELWVYRCTDG